MGNKIKFGTVYTHKKSKEMRDAFWKGFERGGELAIIYVGIPFCVWYVIYYFIFKQ